MKMESVSFESLEKIKGAIGNVEDTIREINDPIRRLDVPGYLSHYGVEIARVKNESDKTIYCLTKCLFDPNHGKGESSIIQGKDGRLSFQCFHNSCQGQTWKEARQVISGDNNLKLFLSDNNNQSHNKQIISEKLSQTDLLSLLETWESIRSMEIKVEWVVDRLIPKESITVLFGKGGIGKTWLSMDMARCVASGMPYLGMATVKAPVIFIDFENPLGVLNTRTQKLGHGEGVYFWRANNDRLKAPKLDRQDYELYKKLPTGAVLIFDTLRAAQDRDENKSDQMGLILGRTKELRDMGFTIILLHHTAKNSDRVAKGSTAIVDLADHILGLTLVKKKKDGEEIVVEDDESEDDLVYRFGVREKTRFEPYHLYLTLNPDRGFDLAPDPQEETLQRMYELLCRLKETDKTTFLSQIKTNIGVSLHKARKLFEIGQGRYWRVDKGLHNKQTVTPIELFRYSTLYSSDQLNNCNPDVQATKITDSEKETQQTNNAELFSYSTGLLQTEKQEIIDVLEVLE